MYMNAVFATIAIVFPFYPLTRLGWQCLNTPIKNYTETSNLSAEEYRVFEPTFTKVADGILGAEGPSFDKEGNLYVVAPGETSNDTSLYRDGSAGKVYRIDVTTGEKTIVCAPVIGRFGGAPVGTEHDKEGSIWIADARLGLWKYTIKDGCNQVAAVDTKGNRLQGLNDLVFDDDGNLWMTSPGGPIAPAPVDFEIAFLQRVGVLYFLEKGKTTPKLIPHQKFFYCNGITVKGDLLLVSESVTGNVISFDITGPGSLENRRVWGSFPKVVYDDSLEEPGGPDGMKLDAAGNLLAPHWGSPYVEVFSPDGRNAARIKCPFTKGSNIRFRSDCTWYVTDHQDHAVWKFQWLTEGRPPYSQP